MLRITVDEYSDGSGAYAAIRDLDDMSLVILPAKDRLKALNLAHSIKRTVDSAGAGEEVLIINEAERPK